MSFSDVAHSFLWIGSFIQSTTCRRQRSSISKYMKQMMSSVKSKGGNEVRHAHSVQLFHFLVEIWQCKNAWSKSCLQKLPNHCIHLCTWHHIRDEVLGALVHLPNDKCRAIEAWRFDFERIDVLESQGMARIGQGSPKGSGDRKKSVTRKSWMTSIYFYSW